MNGSEIIFSPSAYYSSKIAIINETIYKANLQLKIKRSMKFAHIYMNICNALMVDLNHMTYILKELVNDIGGPASTKTQPSQKSRKVQ